jgi:tetratricopeptide (TPR) repeat protein
MLFISMDKGDYQVEKLDNVPVPDMVNHGSMSFSVNYHCLFQHCKSTGGNVLYPEFSGVQLQMVFLMYLENSKSYSETQLSFDRFVNDFGPDDLDGIKNFMYDNIDNCNIRDIMVILKLFDFDHLIFQRLLPRIKQVITKIGHDERERIAEVMQKVWETHFSLGRYFDLSFEIGGILYQLGYYEKALIFFDSSEQLFGFTADVFYNRMMCYYQLRQDDLLDSTLEIAKNLFPDYVNFTSIENLDMESK